MTVHYVCRKCRRGTTITKQVAETEGAPKCPTCGAPMVKEIKATTAVPWTSYQKGFITK